MTATEPGLVESAIDAAHYRQAQRWTATRSKIAARLRVGSKHVTITEHPNPGPDGPGT